MTAYARPAPLFIAGRPRSPSRPDVIQQIVRQIYDIASTHDNACFCEVCFAIRPGHRADRDELVLAAYDARVAEGTDFLVRASC